MTDTGALAQISRARQALAQAKDLSDIKLVRDMAEAARLYARAAGLGQEAMNEAAEVKLRAERKAGEALAARPMSKGAAEPQRDSPGEPRQPTLADDGITKKQSMQWQDEAAVPEPEFEAIVKEAKETGAPLTSKRVARRGREHRQAQIDAAMGRSRHAPRTVAEQASPINTQNIYDARLRAAFSRALASASEINAIAPARVVEVLSTVDANRAESALTQLGSWLERFKAARHDSRAYVVGETNG